MRHTGWGTGAARVLAIGAIGAVGAMAMTACSAGDDAPVGGTEGALEAAPMFAAPKTPEEVVEAKYPFILVPAFNGSAEAGDSWSFNGVEKALVADGRFVKVAAVDPYNGTPERAAKLAVVIDDVRTQFCAATVAESERDGCFTTMKVVAACAGRRRKARSFVMP